MYLYVQQDSCTFYCVKNQFPLNDSICQNSNLLKHMTNKELDGYNDFLTYQIFEELCQLMEEKKGRICSFLPLIEPLYIHNPPLSASKTYKLSKTSPQICINMNIAYMFLQISYLIYLLLTLKVGLRIEEGNLLSIYSQTSTFPFKMPQYFYFILIEILILESSCIIKLHTQRCAQSEEV